MSTGLRLGSYAEAMEIIPATDAATDAPDTDTEDIIESREFDICRTFLHYDGVISACVVRLWVLNNGEWYRGASTADGDELTGVNEIRDWPVGKMSKIFFQVESITGGGTVTVLAEGVQSCH